MDLSQKSFKYNYKLSDIKISNPMFFGRTNQNEIDTTPKADTDYVSIPTSWMKKRSA